VTVVIPCYNYADYLPDAVGSALGQEGVEISVVVVDDASRDSSGAVAEALAAKDPRVTVIRHRENRGPVDTFNDGLALARSEFLVRLDADDMLTPGSLARSVALARAYPSVGLVYGHPIHFEDKPSPARERATGWTIWPGLTWLEGRCRGGVNVITSPEVLMRQSAVDVVGGQRRLAHTHDMEMWLRLAGFADVGYVHGADQAWHRDHARSLSNTAQTRGGLTILRERHLAFRMLDDERVPGGRRLAELAARRLATEALGTAIYEIDRGRFDEALTEELVDVASDIWPDVRSLPEWPRLQRRLHEGAGWTRRRPWLRLLPLRRVAQDAVRGWRWRRRGVYERR
jgi:glycosyltransferase involved in cell wall biosynthesis